MLLIDTLTQLTLLLSFLPITIVIQGRFVVSLRGSQVDIVLVHLLSSNSHYWLRQLLRLFCIDTLSSLVIRGSDVENTRIPLSCV